MSSLVKNTEILIPEGLGCKQMDRSSHNTCTTVVLPPLKSLGIVPVILKKLI